MPSSAAASSTVQVGLLSTSSVMPQLSRSGDTVICVYAVLSVLTQLGVLASEPVRLSIQHPTTGFLGLKDRGLGIYVPMHFECDDETVAAIVSGTIDVDEAGNLVFTTLTFTPRPGGPFIERAALRALSLRTILDEAVRKTAMPWDAETGQIHIDQDTELPVPTSTDDRARLRRTRTASAVNPTDALLRQVAKTYLNGGTRGTEAVRQLLSDRAGHAVHRSTASRLVKECRERKLLGPAIARRSGEAKTKRRKT
jgi:hypothetical protein